MNRKQLFNLGHKEIQKRSVRVVITFDEVQNACAYALSTQAEDFLAGGRGLEHDVYTFKTINVDGVNVTINLDVYTYLHDAEAYPLSVLKAAFQEHLQFSTQKRNIAVHIDD